MFATVFPPRLTSFPLNTCTQSLPRATLRDFLAPFAKLMARAIHEMAAARGALPGRPPRADRRITPPRQRLALAVWSDRSGWHSGHWSAAGAEAAGGPPSRPICRTARDQVESFRLRQVLRLHGQPPGLERAPLAAR